MKLIAFLVKILNAIGIYTKGQYMDVYNAKCKLDDAYAVHKGVEESLASQLEEKTTEVENLRKQLHDMTEQLSSQEITIGTLKKKNDELSAEVESAVDASYQNLDLIKELQKQLGDVFHAHPVFGFPTGIPIPGSTCVTTFDYTKEDGTNVAVLRGRSILTDDMTPRIDNTPGIVERTQLIRDYMDQYDLFSKIGKDLMSRGGIKMTLAYNRNCTAYEVYYEAVVEHASGDAIIVIDKSVTDKNVEDFVKDN